jgi:hypothetical protein
MLEPHCSAAAHHFVMVGKTLLAELFREKVAAF